MTGKERMLAAFGHGVPDMVPVEPGVDIDALAKWSGRPFWEIYQDANASMLELEPQAARKYGYDLWAYYGQIEAKHPPVEGVTVEEEMDREEEKWTKRITTRTPLGTLTETIVYPRDDCAWQMEKKIKDIERDWPRLKYIMGEDWQWGTELIGYDKVGDLGVYGLTVSLPVDWWYEQRDGGTQQCIFDYLDHERKMEEIIEFYTEYAIEYVKAALRARPDEIMLAGSASSLSIISPQIFRKYNLPFIKEATRLCRQAGIVSHLHVCGKSNAVVRMMAEETDLDVMEPLERPPGGDVDLRQVKKDFGKKLCLKGNVNTFITMNKGTPEDVEWEVRECLAAAMEGGGYMLSCGDSCGRDINIENMETMIRVAREYGRY